MMKNLNITNKNCMFVCVPLLLIFLIEPIALSAQGMGSSNYKIESDSINVGGADSSSTIFNLGDSLGELGTGDSNSTNYNMHAGYWQMGETSISISSPTDLVMQSMAGLSGGSSEGAMSWTVMTDDPAGYSMSIRSTTSPALQSANDSLSDYTPSSADPDFNFSIATTESAFGFSPEGTEVISRFKDNGSVCNAGNLETSGKCWDGLSISPKIISGSTTSNMPDGAVTTVRFRAEAGVDKIQKSGDYYVTIVATATTL
jgi:hypothetical protein